MAENFISQGHPVAVILEMCGIARSSWYHHVKPSSKEGRRGKRGRPVPGYTKNPDGTIVTDISIVKAIRDIRSDINFANGGGYQKLKHYLRRDFGYHVNHKKLYRLCKENDLLLPHRKKKLKKNRRISTNRVINGPNQLWEFDLKYGYIHGIANYKVSCLVKI